MKVQNMRSTRSNNDIPNQFIITEEGRGALGNFRRRETFQSYTSIIATITYWNGEFRKVEVDEKYWNYSKTTSKYRSEFLGETTKETEAKIKNGEYKLINLNS